MKRLLAVCLCTELLVLALCAPAQTPLGLGVQLYSGLSITGAVGTVCTIQYVTDLAPVYELA